MVVTFLVLFVPFVAENVTNQQISGLSAAADCGRYGAHLWSVSLVQEPPFHSISAF